MGKPTGQLGDAPDVVEIMGGVAPLIQPARIVVL
jgi:hypothetical protein